jgi:putative flippase GtrA
MSLFVRWWKFNLVGAMGMLLQLSMLALLNHYMAGHYLLSSAVAIEFVLLHNFTWHLLYTWRDRRQHFAVPTQLLRFHLSNGLVSMLGNLMIMRFLVQGVHLPVLLSNCIAIGCCSMINFLLSNRWAFATAQA